MPSRPGPGRREASKGRAPSSRKGGGRPPRKTIKSAGKGTRGGTVASGIPKPLFLPLLTVWLLAVVILASLLYWDRPSDKPPRDHAANKVAPTGGPSGPKPKATAPPARPPENNTAAARRPSSDGAGSHPATPEARPPEPKTPEARPLEARQTEARSPEARPPGKTTPPTGKPLIEPPPQFQSRDLPITEPKETDHKSDGIALSALKPAVPPTPPPAPPPPTPRPPVARVAIVIDDFGLDLEIAKKFLNVPLPITFAILPNQTHTKEIAELAHERHHEVLLHLPMEPQGYPKANPGPGALLTSMSRDRVRRTLLADLDASPYFSGVNNHMGSKFTESAPFMSVVMSELRQRKLYFVDSATTANSVGFELARKFRVPARKRDIFLDNTQTEESVRSQLDQLIRKAKVEGTALAIGHPHEATLNVLTDEAAERFRKENVAVVPSSELLIAPPEHAGGRD